MRNISAVSDCIDIAHGVLLIYYINIMWCNKYELLLS